MKPTEAPEHCLYCLKPQLPDSSTCAEHLTHSVDANKKVEGWEEQAMRILKDESFGYDDDYGVHFSIIDENEEFAEKFLNFIRTVRAEAVAEDRKRIRTELRAKAKLSNKGMMVSTVVIDSLLIDPK